MLYIKDVKMVLQNFCMPNPIPIKQKIFSIVLKRCISPIHPTICPRIPKDYLQNRMPREIIGTTTPSINEPEIECKTRNKLGHEYLMDKMKTHDTMLSRFVGNAIAHITNATDAQQVGFYFA